ncbi:hypothetical protein J6590_094367, partial [Homalodisca vitripennis]
MDLKWLTPRIQYPEGNGLAHQLVFVICCLTQMFPVESSVKAAACGGPNMASSCGIYSTLTAEWRGLHSDR